jgi:hypothetical protein
MMDVVRLENGNTMIADAKRGRIIDVDRAGKVVWSYESPDIGNMVMRSCRRTAAGRRSSEWKE